MLSCLQRHANAFFLIPHAERLASFQSVSPYLTEDGSESSNSRTCSGLHLNKCFFVLAFRLCHSVLNAAKFAPFIQSVPYSWCAGAAERLLWPGLLYSVFFCYSSAVEIPCVPVHSQQGTVNKGVSWGVAVSTGKWEFGGAKKKI